MKLSEIIKHCQKTLPKYTSYFSDAISVTSLTSVNNICTVVTEEPHNLKAGDLFTIEGAKVANKIVSLTQTRGLGTLITEHPHEVTKNSPLRDGDSTHIEIYNANEEEYNGRFLIMAIPNANVIEFSIDSDAPAVATGEPEIKEEVYATYNGRQLVKEIIDDNTFTFALPYVPEATKATGDIKIKNGIRITGDFSVTHAIKAYEEMETDELWGFVVMDGVSVSKSRVNFTDAISTFVKGADLNIDAIQDISFFIFVPTSSDYCWTDFVDLCQDLRNPILKTLHNARFDSGVTDEDAYLSFVGDNPVDIEGTAYLVYQYKFQTTLNIYNEDGVVKEFKPKIKGFKMYEKNNNEELEGTVQYISEGEIPDESID